MRGCEKREREAKERRKSNWYEADSELTKRVEWKGKPKERLASPTPTHLPDSVLHGIPNFLLDVSLRSLLGSVLFSCRRPIEFYSLISTYLSHFHYLSHSHSPTLSLVSPFFCATSLPWAVVTCLSSSRSDLFPTKTTSTSSGAFARITSIHFVSDVNVSTRVMSYTVEKEEG